MISTLSIRNFKSILDTTFEFSNINLLTGYNGVGKSSSIQVLLLLRQSYLQNLLAQGLYLNGDLIKLGSGKDILSEKSQESIIGFNIAWNDNTYAEFKFEYQEQSDLLALISNPVYNKYNIPFNDEFYYLNAERITPKPIYETSNHQISLKNFSSNGLYALHYLSAKKDETVKNKNILNPKAKSDKLLEQANAWLSEISPGTRINSNIIAGTELLKLDFSFEFGDGISNPYRAVNVGFGLTYILPVIIACLIADENSMLIVENPEAHLHPSGQTKIGEMLAKTVHSKSQIIIETHSDHVVDGIRLSLKEKVITPENLKTYFFNLSQDNHRSMINKIEINEKGRISKNAPKGFFDEFDRNISRLLK